jgi:hypothetical protein
MHLVMGCWTLTLRDTSSNFVPGLVDRLEVDGNGAIASVVDASHV